MPTSAATKSRTIGGLALAIGLASLFAAPAFSQVSYDEICDPANKDKYGVVRCYGFDDLFDLENGDPSSIHGPSRMKPPCPTCSGLKEKLCTVTKADTGKEQCYYLDPSVKSSGESSLRFEIPPSSASDVAGNFRLNFADDFSERFKPGTSKNHFCYQYRVRMSAGMLQDGTCPTPPPEDPNLYKGDTKRKHKFGMVGDGDDSTGNFETSNTAEEMVFNMSRRGEMNEYGLSWYHRSDGDVTMEWRSPELPDGTCDGGSNAIAYQHFEEPGYCCRNGDNTGCRYLASDSWMTFQACVNLGGFGEHPDNRVEVWFSDGSGGAEKIYDSIKPWPNGMRLHGDDDWGKIWLTPYNTGRESDCTFPRGFIWYDDLIISTKRLPDPVSSPGDPPPSDPPTIPGNIRFKPE